MQALGTDKQADNILKGKSWTLHPYSEGDLVVPLCGALQSHLYP